MQDADPLDQLIKLSHAFGANPAYIQGGGGNTSIKPLPNLMHVKASGTCLKDMTTTSGHVSVDPCVIRAILRDGPRDDNAHARAVREAASTSHARPSMETGFHAVLDNVVAHSHSVYLNVLTCAAEGQELAQELFPEACWVPYLAPGLALSCWIQDHPDHAVYLLQNHGIIVSGKEPEEVLGLHEEINQAVRQKLGLSVDFTIPDIDLHDLDTIRSQVLFPDQVIFTSADSTLLNTAAAKETLAAHRYIMDGLHHAGLTPHFLQEGAADVLLNMDAEKDRQRLAT